MLEILDVVPVFRLSALAPIPVLDILLRLLAEIRHAAVDGGHDLVEVASHLCHRGDAGQAEAVEPPRQRGQRAERPAGAQGSQSSVLLLLLLLGLRGGGDAAACGLGVGAQLHEGGVGSVEDRLVLRVPQNLQRRADAQELLGAEPRAHGPLLRLLLAPVLGLLEESLVGLELRLRVVPLHLAVGQQLGLLRLVARVLLQSGLQVGQLPSLGGHQLLKGLLPVGLGTVVLLHVGHEAVVEALEDALDLRALRRVVPERIAPLPGDHLQGGAGLPLSVAAKEVTGLLNKAPEGLHVLTGRPAGGAVPQKDLLHARRDADELGLLDGLEESLLRAGARERSDRSLERPDRGLGLRLGGLESLGFGGADLRGLALGLLVGLDVLLDLPDLCAVRRDLGAELRDLLRELEERGPGVGHVLSLAVHGVLTPAHVLVIGLLLDLPVRDEIRLQVGDELGCLVHRRLVCSDVLEEFDCASQRHRRERGRGHGRTAEELHCRRPWKCSAGRRSGEARGGCAAEARGGAQ
mmetsp:Transcript_55312/g.144245  ORF Transcript_55312/g.144245 Transcript_55312/m.144245 type:complete len:521 (+) Transcript_55312:812-2374(+)